MKNIYDFSNFYTYLQDYTFGNETKGLYHIYVQTLIVLFTLYTLTINDFHE